jgi:putative ABC transport system permease protein
LRNVGLGIVAGIGLSVAGGRLVGAMLFATSPSDARVLLLGSVGLGVLAMAASAIPALRASRADPMVVLRGE